MMVYEMAVTPELEDLSLKLDGLDGDDCPLDPTKKIFAIDLKTGAWAVDSNPEVTSLCHWDGKDDKNEFYVGTDKGYVVKFDVDDKYADSIENVETDIECFWQSGDRNFRETLGENAEFNKRFIELFFRAEIPESTTVTVIASVDFGAYTEEHTVSLLTTQNEYRVNFTSRAVGRFISLKFYEKSQKSLKIYGYGIKLQVLSEYYKKV